MAAIQQLRCVGKGLANGASGFAACQRALHTAATSMGANNIVRKAMGSFKAQLKLIKPSQHASRQDYASKVVLAALAVVPLAANNQKESQVEAAPRAPQTIAPPQGVSKKGWSLWRWIKYLWQVAGKDVMLVMLAGALCVAAISIGLVIPDIMGSFWDAFNNSESLLYPAAKLAIALLAKFIVQALASALLTSSTESMAAAIRQDLFSRLLDYDMSFFDVTDTAELVSLLTDDVKEVRDAVRAIFGEGIPSVAHSVGTVAKLVATSAKLSVGLAATLPFMLLVGNLYASRLRALSRRNQELQAQTAGVATESLSNIRTVRAFTGEEEELRKYYNAQQRSSESSARLGAEINIFRAVVTLGLSSFGGLIMLFGGNLVQNGEMSRGQLASFLTQSLSLEGSLEGLSSITSKLLKASGTAQRVGSALDTASVVNRRGGARWPTFRGDVLFDHVTFSYPSRPDATVLNDVTLRFPAGKVIALCGASGSGKSTVASLLLGYYEPAHNGGSVSVDGRKLTAVDLQWYREHVAYVPQDAAMFNTTIRENILYGNQDASDEEIYSALKAAHADEFIARLPRGLDTRVGERGLSMSGGQRQRIALARALLRNPKILILDEYSSALDAEAEAVVQAAVKEKFEDRTVVIIAHRLSTIAAADTIYVMNKGVVLEHGSHAELYERGGAYATLVRRQSASGTVEADQNDMIFDPVEK